MSEIEEDGDYRRVTQNEKNTWNSKANISDIRTTLASMDDYSSHNFITQEERDKIASGVANKITCQKADGSFADY